MNEQLQRFNDLLDTLEGKLRLLKQTNETLNDTIKRQKNEMDEKDFQLLQLQEDLDHEKQKSEDLARQLDELNTQTQNHMNELSGDMNNIISRMEQISNENNEGQDNQGNSWDNNWDNNNQQQIF
ncbi:MAG: hypothetical protein Q4C78_00105 [Synergistaceae bacterium]|nr:hypothetical protein [Synergistaceae bacterium]